MWSMWWKKKPAPEKSLREQLFDARQALENQIANLEAGPSYMITPDAIHGRLMRSGPLRKTLSEINEQIALLEAGEA